MATARKIPPFLILALACVPAWGQAGKNSSANAPQVFDRPAATAVGNEAIPQSVNPSTYLIGPEDILKIEVYMNDQLSRLVNVRPDGKITLLLIGDIQAEGLTPERLTAQVKEAYSQTIIDPQVIISVMQVNSKSFSITGKVNKSGRFQLVKPIRVFDALSLAGGFQDFANTKKITIVRGTQRLFFNWNDYVKGKKEAQDQNILLQDGDTISVK